MGMNTDLLIATLHEYVKAKSSVPKVANAIGRDYYSLRDNLKGTTEMKLKDFYAILDFLDINESDLRTFAAAVGRSLD